MAALTLVTLQVRIYRSASQETAQSCAVPWHTLKTDSPSLSASIWNWDALNFSAARLAAAEVQVNSLDEMGHNEYYR